MSCVIWCGGVVVTTVGGHSTFSPQDILPSLGLQPRGMDFPNHPDSWAQSEKCERKGERLLNILPASPPQLANHRLSRRIPAHRRLSVELKHSRHTRVGRTEKGWIDLDVKKHLLIFVTRFS